MNTKTALIILVVAVGLVLLYLWQFGAPAPQAPVTNTTPEETETEEVRDVVLYYYNPARDTDAEGNILCSRAGLVSVQREIPVTITPIQDTVRLLLEGELTPAERAQGITTEYPLEGFTLVGANIDGGTLALEFDDPDNMTSGGSCRAGILWFQIEQTALQFDEVESVRFIPEDLFQP